MDGLTLQSQSSKARSSLEQRFRDGDDTAFDEVVALYAPAIGKLVHRLSGWQTDGEDVVQDVFVAALANRQKFKGTASLKTWLFAIAVNRCRSYNRRQFLRQRLLRGLMLTSGSAGSGQDKQPQTEIVRLALARLPAKYRDVLVLKYLEELPTEEIMHILNIQQNTLYTRLNRAKKLMQEKMAHIAETDNE